MEKRFEINVQGRDLADSQVLTAELMSALRLTSSEVQVERIKKSEETMDMGATIAIIVTSGAAAAVARGIAAWLSKRQSAKITISKDGSLTAEGVTSADAVRLAEIIGGAVVSG